MKNMIRMAVMMGLVLSGLASRADEVLYWMIDDPMIYDKCGVEYNLSDRSITEQGKEMSIARVAAFVDGSGDQSYAATRLDDGFAGDVVYLDLYFDDGNGKWALDMPNNSSSLIIDGRVDPYERASVYASLEFAGKVPDTDLSAFSFAIELGAYDDDLNWVVAAISGTETYASLHGFIGDQLDIPDPTRWMPGAYAAPEPTSGLLTLVGLALIGLKRKKED